MQLSLHRQCPAALRSPRKQTTPLYATPHLNFQAAPRGAPDDGDMSDDKSQLLFTSLACIAWSLGGSFERYGALFDDDVVQEAFGRHRYILAFETGCIA